VDLVDGVVVGEFAVELFEEQLGDALLPGFLGFFGAGGDGAVGGVFDDFFDCFGGVDGGIRLGEV
jgi:hypothetical protein